MQLFEPLKHLECEDDGDGVMIIVGQLKQKCSLLVPVWHAEPAPLQAQNKTKTKEHRGMPRLFVLVTSQLKRAEMHSHSIPITLAAISFLFHPGFPKTRNNFKIIPFQGRQLRNLDSQRCQRAPESTGTTRSWWTEPLR